MKLLIVEDNHDILENIFEYFEIKGHTLDSAQDGINALRLAASNDYDAIVLDLMLPGVDGMEICLRLRNDARIDTPILILTAKDSLDDKLLGFNSGADDYLIKPFALPELEARLSALLRRGRSLASSTIFCVDDLTLNIETLEVQRQGQHIELSNIARSILELLMRHSPRVVTRKEIEGQIWGDDVPDSDILRSHIYQLRMAIDRPFSTPLLQTIPKVGYRLAPASMDN